LDLALTIEQDHERAFHPATIVTPP
jgi:hypothetical protein